MDFEVQQLSTVENIRLSVVEGASFTVYDLLFKHGRVAANWDNIFNYMYTDVDDEILWAFLLTIQRCFQAIRSVFLRSLLIML